MGAALRYEPLPWSSPSRTSSFHRRAIRPLGVGASVGADCSRMPNIDRHWATATVPDSVLRQHAMKAADTQRNSPPLVTDQGVEMRDWKQVRMATDMAIFFCDPHAPGNGAPMRIRTACFASTSPRAPT